MAIQVKKVIAYEVNGQLIPQKEVAEILVRKLVLEEIFAEELKHNRTFVEVPEVIANKWGEINRRVAAAFAGT